MKRMLAALATAVAAVGPSAQAQYTFEPVAVTGPSYGFFGTTLGYSYPNGYTVGYDYVTYTAGLTKPDGTFVPCPISATLNCVSNSGKCVGGLTPYRDDGTGCKGFRWNVETGEIEYLDAAGSGWQYASPAAIADDGAAIVTGAKDGWLSGGTWKVGTDKVVYVQCQPNSLPGAAGAYLQAAYYLEKGDGDNYVLYGRGWTWSSWWMTTFKLTGPLQ